MELHKAKKVVIVTEAAILVKISELITEHGVTGYNVHSVEGKGEKGEKFGSDFISGLYKCIKIETITSEEVAKKIAVEVLDRFFIHYSGIIYLEDVEIIRAKKFRLPG